MKLNQKLAKKLRKMAKQLAQAYAHQDQGKTLTEGYFENQNNKTTHYIKNGDQVQEFLTVGTLVVHDKSEDGYYKALKKKLKNNDF